MDCLGIPFGDFFDLIKKWNWLNEIGNFVAVELQTEMKKWNLVQLKWLGLEEIEVQLKEKALLQDCKRLEKELEEGDRDSEIDFSYSVV